MVITRDVPLPDGRVLRAHDTGGSGPALVWHHGTPQTGSLYEPLLGLAAARGVRLVSCARPGYGGSTPRPGRSIASAAADVAHAADALGLDRFAVLGSSSGGSHALACAAVAPARVTAVACFAAVAPYSGRDEWFAGMISDGALRAALVGRGARARHAEQDEFDPAVFTEADLAALDGEWAGMGADAGAAGSAGADGEIDDDVALVGPWGCELTAVTAPVLLVHGGQDRVIPPAHAGLLAAAVPGAERWDRPHDGHITVLAACAQALDWVLTATDR
ncbi:alpha/beta fold hydrolase [Pseudonocardia kunmingensis]|uniref:Pimeloyl-ACP methyl ester carboxylesterase n=1 Tax=Pseudonocardia kunmingensis TaxID=630975 RepID=A0A543D3A9_9PSEU|nr:alpha/beta hydrolase [Pseudonocardia kunmingensis]TQM03823.1 pimeloyl-ACP methyl ester carboxylesterase [Pseudonocardia kunmingensis]